MFPVSEPVIKASNRSYRYGDGLFETMRLSYGNIILGKYHFSRLFDSLALLKFVLPSNFTREKIEHDIIELAHLNNCTNRARIRLSVSRGNGSLAESDHQAEYIIECEKLDSPYTLNDTGLKTDLFPFAQKSRDIFSNLKSASYLHSVMGSKFASEHDLDDCILLNSLDEVADTTIANIFLCSDKIIHTPGPGEGCVHGVMRRYLIEVMLDTGYKVEETRVTPDQLAEADEVFLTNAIKGIQWVGSFRGHTYGNEMTTTLFNRFIRTIQS